eukprot:s816_g5.t1
MSDGAAVPVSAAGSTGETDTVEETAQQRREEREFQAASAATTLSRRLSKQQRKASAASKVQPNAARSDLVSAGFMFPAQPKPRQSKTETGLMAMMEDVLPSNCVLRRNGCWPKKKAKKTVK